MATQMQVLRLTAQEEAELATFGEEDELRGNLTFKPTREVLPNTIRTQDLKRKKLELLRKKKEEEENSRKKKEQEEAQRRLKEQEAKKLKQQQEQRRKEEERKRREEEEQRKKMEGGLDKLLAGLTNNDSDAAVSASTIELGSVRLRLLAQALENNTSAKDIDLSRRKLNDEDGVALAQMLQKNETLEKLELEGNSLGVRAASALAEALMVNKTLKVLILDGNSLTAGGQDHSGVIDLANTLGKKKNLTCLSLRSNNIGAPAIDAFADAVSRNEIVTVCDLSHNDAIPMAKYRVFDAFLDRNKALLSQSRRNERRERFEMFAEEFSSRQWVMEVETMRLETEAQQERRLARMTGLTEKWARQAAAEEQELNDIMQDLQDDYEDRRSAKKGKKGKKKK